MISIIIIVKNDREIDSTLNSLTHLKSGQVKEILVVDASKNKLDDIRRKYPDVNWIQYVNNGKKHITIPEQRNVGVKNAKGNIIVFTDANCVPEQNWLDELVMPILESDESITAGATLSLNGKTIHDQTADRNINKKYIEECPTINLAVKKDVFKKVGEFDESFDYGSDVDFSWRVQDAGYKIRNVPTAVIRHNWGTTSEEMKRSYLYGRARARLYKKHTSKLKNLLTKDIIVVIYSAYIILLPLTFIFPYYPFIILLLLIKNYNKDPFHVVLDHLIYACGVLREVLLPL